VSSQPRLFPPGILGEGVAKEFPVVSFAAKKILPRCLNGVSLPRVAFFLKLLVFFLFLSVISFQILERGVAREVPCRRD